MTEKKETTYLFSMFSPEFRHELRDVIRDTNLEVINELRENADPKINLVNQITLKKILSCGQPVIDDMITQGLPAYKIGRQVMFKLDEVEEIISQKYRVY